MSFGGGNEKSKVENYNFKCYDFCYACNFWHKRFCN